MVGQSGHAKIVYKDCRPIRLPLHLRLAVRVSWKLELPNTRVGKIRRSFDWRSYLKQKITWVLQHGSGSKSEPTTETVVYSVHSQTIRSAGKSHPRHTDRWMLRNQIGDGKERASNKLKATEDDQKEKTKIQQNVLLQRQGLSVHVRWWTGEFWPTVTWSPLSLTTSPYKRLACFSLQVYL